MFFFVQSDLNITASFDRRGEYIYTGNGKGRILVLNSNTLEVMIQFKVYDFLNKYLKNYV